MRTNYFLTIIALLILCNSAVLVSQNNVKVDLKSNDSIILTKFDIFPADYPNISIVFSAENNKGQPLWDLKKKDVIIYENEKKVNIEKLIRISDIENINISFVIDHSESMSESFNYFKNGKIVEPYTKWKEEIKDGRTIIIPESSTIDTSKFDEKRYERPLVDACNAIEDFLQNSKKINNLHVNYVSFNTRVTETTRFYHNNYDEIISKIKKLKPKGETAFFDALNSALSSLDKKEGINLVIALTDGIDNKSNTKVYEILKKAQEQEIPVFIIGYGSVDSFTLTNVASQTNGKFYYTNDSKTFTDIYEQVSRKVLSIYEATYFSPNLKSSEKNREVELKFYFNELPVANNLKTYQVPEQNLQLVNNNAQNEFIDDKLKEYAKKIHYLEQDMYKNKSLINYLSVKYEEVKKLSDIYLYSGLGLAILLGTSFLVFRAQQKKKENIRNPVLQSAFPNPCIDQITFVYELNEMQNSNIKIFDINGNQMIKDVITDTHQTTINVSNLPSGVYIALISGINSSNTIKFIKSN